MNFRPLAHAPAVLCALLTMLPATTSGADGSAATGKWLNDVTRRIASDEYHFAPQPDGSWSAPNRNHGLRTAIDDTGIRIEDRVDGDLEWSWGWSLVWWGRSGVRMEQTRPVLRPENDRVELLRGELDEWYVNRTNGLEQGFTIHHPPQGDGHLVVAGRLDGNLTIALHADLRGADLKSSDGATVLRYAHLMAFDAVGTDLECWLEVTGSELRLVTDDRDAIYPVTIDPLLSLPGWTAVGDQASASFASKVATAGDVNGDGYADVLVGAQSYDHGQGDEGRVYLYLGSAAGPETSAAWIEEPDVANVHLGTEVATAGDVNGDGYADVIVSGSGFSDPEFNEGIAYVYHGSGAGLAADPAWSFASDQADAALGRVACAGDVNGDGYSDVVVGARRFTSPEVDEGRAWVFHGSASGLGSSPAQTLEPNVADAFFGDSVGTAGDVNGDGFADVIVGAYRYSNDLYREGGAFVYYGSAAGIPGTPSWTAEGDQYECSFGISVATAGDVDGDGYTDIIVGSSGYETTGTDRGRLWLFKGSASGLAATAAWTYDADQDQARCGTKVAPAGDVDGDGFADFAMGCPFYDNLTTEEGRVDLFYGSAGGPGAVPDWTVTGSQQNEFVGYTLGPAGDTNGDGLGDLIIGGEGYDNWKGRASVYLGSTSGIADAAGWSAEADQDIADLGWSLATAGDVNGDGFADVVVGARRYDGSAADSGRALVYHGSATGLATAPAWTVDGAAAEYQLGFSVGTAGDVNGDGFADVVVGIPYQTNGEATEGIAAVFPGSSGGLSTTPSWFAEPNQAGAHFGMSVGTAGDVNGDGFADVIIGAPDYDGGQTNEGRVFVYYGAASWPSSSPDWTAETNQATARLGFTVGTAGDVNGDGFSDVIAGAPDWTAGISNEGLVAVWHGSRDGLGNGTSWTFVSDLAGAHLGEAAATAGDVNGDGYSDVIAGARSYDPGIWGGEAWVFHGSAAGLAATAAWTGDNDQASASYGRAVATAGDVNGDGFADVLVGAHMYDNPELNEGRVSLYLGSGSGLGSSAAWTAESNQDQSGFGYALGTAGDVNGDGYAEVLIGAYRYDHGNTDEGLAQLYYGNDGPGLGQHPRQRQGSDSAPISHLGATTDASVRIKMLGRSPFGRTGSRLEVEVKPLGTSFDGTATVVGSSYSDTGTTGATLGEQVSGLTAGTVYHWRSRVLYHPASSPFLQHGPWLTMPWNGWQEGDLRTLACSTANPPTITGASSICQGSSTVLDAGAGFSSYDWSPGGQTTRQISVSPSTSTTYTVWVKDGEGCDGTDDHTVTVEANPAPTITGPTSTCAGEAVVLDAGAGYEEYLWLPGGQTTRTIAVNPSSTTTYRVEVSTSHGCTGGDDHRVTVYPAASPTIVGPDELCPGTTAELDCGAGFNEYLWSPGGKTTRFIEISPTVTTQYTCAVVSADGCEGEDTHRVDVFEAANPTIVGPDELCLGSSAELDCGAGFKDYEWSPGGERTRSIEINPTSPTEYTCTATTWDGCEGADTHRVDILETPMPNITGPTDVCDSEVFTLDAGAGYSSYLWSPRGETTRQITTALHGTTGFGVTVSYSNSCEGDDDHTVTVHPNPAPTITGPDQIDLGQNAVLDAGAGYSTYLWSPGGETTQQVTVSPNETTTYTVTVTTVWDCLGQDSHTVTVVISQDEIFSDGFESGNTSAWSS